MGVLDAVLVGEVGAGFDGGDEGVDLRSSDPVDEYRDDVPAHGLDSALTRPLYTLREAAAVVDVRPSTMHRWARGYVFKGVDGEQHQSEALITTTGVGRGPVVPFVGLAEAYVLAAFRAAGVPMQRIRPALARLEREYGVAAALTSERLKTDGAEVLWEYKSEGGDAGVVDELVVIRSQQIIFRDVVQQYLRTITYRDGRVALIGLPQYRTRSSWIRCGTSGDRPSLGAGSGSTTSSGAWQRASRSPPSPPTTGSTWTRSRPSRWHDRVRGAEVLPRPRLGVGARPRGPSGNGSEVLARFLQHEADVFRWARRTRPPFVLGLGPRATGRLRLNLP